MQWRRGRLGTRRPVDVGHFDGVLEAFDVGRSPVGQRYLKRDFSGYATRDNNLAGSGQGPNASGAVNLRA